MTLCRAGKTGYGVGMSEDIEELNSRIMAAMDRVAKGVEALGGTEAQEVDALKQELEEEKQANAQLSERVRVLGERQEQALETLQSKASAAQDRVSALDSEVQKLRQANERLIKMCTALRDANAEGVGEAHLINQSVIAELEAIRTMRSAEMAEADEIIAALMPLVQNAISGDETKEAN